MVYSLEFIIIFILTSITAIVSFLTHKLTFYGTLASLFLAFCVSLSGFEYFMIMLAFYISSNVATEYNFTIKEKLVSTSKKDKTRTATQVFNKGLFPSIISLVLYIKFNGELNLNTDNKTKKILQGMYIAFYCFATADTWASEIGMCGKDITYLITTFRVVPKGVNGGVSKTGIKMSILGGGFIAFISIICSAFRFGASEMQLKTIFKMIIFGFIWGLIGSIIDSVLGAKKQLTIYDLKNSYIIDKSEVSSKSNVFYYGEDVLDNGQVNLISGIATSILACLMLSIF